jgi:type I restriction enzyme, S subunit
MYYTNSEHGRNYFKEASKQTTNLASINLTQLRNCPILLPPLSEQIQLLTEIEQRLSVADQVEAAADAGLKRAGRLRQAILKLAFEGRLVPQDPKGEAASGLLDRIEAEQVKTE